MTTWLRLWSLVTLALITGLTGCQESTENDGKRTTIQKPDHTVTVIDPPASSSSSSTGKSVTMDKMERLDGVYALDWLNERQLLISKENPDTALIDSENGKKRPFQIYIRDIATGQDKLLKGSQNLVESGPIVSPDGKHVFLHESRTFEMDGNSGVLVDVVKGGSRIVTPNDRGGLELGTWTDSDHFIVPNGRGSILDAGTDGQDNVLLTLDESAAISYAAKLGQRLYYVTNDTLSLYRLDDKTTAHVENNVWRLSASPNGSQLAVVKNTGQTERTLLLLDAADPAKRAILGIATQFYAFDWSPDGAYIAFSVYSKEKDGLNGVYVVNAKTGKMDQLGDFQETGSLAWSPSGKQIMVSSSVFADNQMKYATYLLDLK
ncbi:hypothetical protein [Paenibacillus thalictri]|uniref:Uncharacterized protein n=1 Tax=Paenibacillus thalictri TaxID=2527873 RepID=A0A4Q9DW95_9BACL|nr:hypothetical protein [Paenibacillus thalictri]TBL80666.1 hypothetical protein EYB31_05415 [Paenibacillus thalictri]